MRIGIISTIDGYSWAGSEELWGLTAKCLLSDGHFCSALVTAKMKNSEKLNTLVHSGLEVSFRKKIGHPRINTFVNKWYNQSFTFLRKNNVVIVSLGSILDVFYISGLYQALLNTETKIVFLCQFNSDILHFQPEQRKKLIVLFKKSSYQVFVSEGNLNLAERQLAFSFSSPKVIYNPIKFFCKTELKFPLLDRVSFGCVARFETLWKGFDVLLDVFSKSQWKDRNWELNLYGSGPDEDYIKSLIHHYRLEENVNIVGFKADVQNIWMDNHIMVLPSRGEGIPLAILEAMMCARPVITTNVGGNIEVLEDTMGYIAEAATVNLFEDVLEKAWKTRLKWEEMGKNAFKKAHSLYSLDPARQLINLCKDTTKNSNV